MTARRPDTSTSHSVPRGAFLLIGILGSLFLSSPAYPATQDLKGEVTDEKSQPISAAVCTLTGGALQPQGLTVNTGERGEFHFPGLVPGTYALTCAAVTYQPIAKDGIVITDTQAPTVQVVLPPEIIVRQRVEVSEKADRVTQESTAPPATLSAPQLRSLPLVEQKFKAALPLVPGVIRTPDGRTNIKGQVETQGMLLVDSAETVDPVTGSFSIEIPIDAIESLDVHKAAYQTEYGRFSGGLTSIQTKAPSNQWHYELNDFLPTMRGRSGHLVGVASDSPRFYLTGPVWKDHLNFSESFVYTFNRQPVRGLAWPNNETKTQGFTSFTNLQYIFTPRHLLTASINVFPERQQYADINSLIPQSASTDYGQRGYSVAATDRYLFVSGSVLTSLFKWTDFSSYAHGQGPQDMLITPDGHLGNFFNTWSRASTQQEFSQNFQFPQWERWGRHELKIGGDLVHRDYDGTSVSHPVEVLRPDGALAQRIDFTGPASLKADDTEVALFAQDHWILNDRVALDVGLRFSGQTIGDKAALAPRVGFVWTPGEGGRTILRGGLGVFNDRVPLLAGDYTSNPFRTVTLFDAQGLPLGPPQTYQNVYVMVDEKGRQIIPPGQILGSTPYNITWNLEASREIAPHLLVRASYLSSRTFNEFIVDPTTLPDGSPILLLTNTGGVRYHEFEATMRYRRSENADLNFSYVRSLARGDLNSMSAVYVPFEQPVIRPNFFAALPSNIPHRIIAWGRVKIPWKITAAPVLDLHSGFPYSAYDVYQNYLGPPNGQRFPKFLSLDLRLSKDFRISFIPWVKNHTLRGALQIFNLTNHANPRDVYSSVASSHFGDFAGFQHRTYDLALDVLF